MMSEAKFRVLLYCPEAFVHVHYKTMLTLGRILAGSGHKVDVAYCDALYERCVVMDSVRLPPGQPRAQTTALCDRCTASARQFVQQSGLNSIDLAPYHTLQRSYEAARLVAQADDPSRIELDGNAIGTAALHDVVMIRKLVLDEPMQALDAAQLQETVRTTLLSYLSMKDLLVDRGYTHLLTFGHYAVLQGAAAAARTVGVKWRNVSHSSHYGIDRRLLTIDPCTSFQRAFRVLKSWPDWRTIPLTADEVLEIGRDMLLRFSGFGSHTYSSAKSSSDVIDSLGFSRDRKLIVAYTSSLDERNAEEAAKIHWYSGEDRTDPASLPHAFPDQISWLRFMVDWVRDRDDVQLAIRIHPREDSNKRDSLRSRHLGLLENALTDLPANVRVIWPSDAISSYDLLEAAHLVQVSWTTMGLEAARLGIPTMTCDGYSSLPTSGFIPWPGTPEAFAATTEQLLSAAPDLDLVIAGLRFYALSWLHCAVNIADINPHPHAVELTDAPPPANAATILRLVDEGCGAERINLSQRPETTPHLVEQERLTVLYLLRVILRFLMTGVSDGNNYALHVQAVAPEELDASVPPPAEGTAIFLHSGDRGRFVSAEGSVTKHSAMAVRLAALCA